MTPNPPAAPPLIISKNTEIYIAYALVIIGMLILCFQLIVCCVARFCRWSKRLLFLAPPGGDLLVLTNVLATVALGILPMDATASVLIMCLLVFMNKYMPAYGGETNKMLWCVWTAFNLVWFAGSHAWSALIISRQQQWLSAIFVIMLVAYVYCFLFVTLKKADKYYYQAIAKEMRKSEQTSKEWYMYNYVPYTRFGYCYVVLLEPPNNRSIPPVAEEEAAERRSTTVHDIYTYVDAEQHSNKELCLSFAMFQLLFGLCHGAPWYQDESSRRKSRDLIVKGLLVPPYTDKPVRDDGYYDLLRAGAASNGFRVVEMELAFLYDHMYGGAYILWSPHSGAWRALYYVLKAAMAVIVYIAIPVILYLHASASGDDDDDRPRVSCAILIPLLPYLLFDLLQVMFHCRSDVRMVSCTCHPDAWQHRYFGWFVSFIRRFTNCNNNFFYGLDSVGQYSLLQETTPHKDEEDDNGGGGFFRTGSRRLYKHSAKPSPVPAALPQNLKLRIAEVLGGKSCQVDMPPEVEEAQRSLVGDEPQHKIAMILKWHIATSYCEMRLPTKRPSRERELAAVLSKYCAYLVAFRPELLPCSDSETSRTFCDVLKEVRLAVEPVQQLQYPGARLAALDGRRTRPPGVHDFEGLAQGPDILTHGLRLGDTLATTIPIQEHLWTILEAIWVNLILRVAPQQSTSDPIYTKSHAKCLAEGGEFVTYLWAMLSHAGIENHSTWGPCIQQIGRRLCVSTYDPWV
ncbi:hypothetical protein U9M48_030085 [Paspalum notatum var. saurae]|uniref:DUF4220 domain-containing protein n=1 Tax=Paspalum notatum var. saurae TaxID=547442 RepID=A0AAQ3TZZ6_PASNO